MSTYVWRPLVRRPHAERRAPDRDAGEYAGRPSLFAAACRELWKRTAGGSVERLPDPNRHPECWFRLV
jgi:hypothetical protein